MGFLRLLWRAPVILLWVFFGLFLVGIIYPFSQMPFKLWLNRNWSRGLVALCGVRVRVSGALAAPGALMLVSNHVSWLDIFIINSVRPTSFIAKSEIRQWPVVGSLVAGAGTLFIERTQRHAVLAVGEEMQRRFDCGETVGLFPEGTTSEGDRLLPFHSNLFAPARTAAVAVQPVALRYWHGPARSSLIAFVGEQTLVANVATVLRHRGLAVELVFLPSLSTGGVDGETPSRVQLSRAAHASIETALLK